MSDSAKTKRAKYFKDNAARNIKMHEHTVAKAKRKNVTRFEQGNLVMRGTARRQRRVMGDLAPVNPMASMTQHPQGRYARSVSKEQFQQDCDRYMSITNPTE